jgi:hypothetical protein
MFLHVLSSLKIRCQSQTQNAHHDIEDAAISCKDRTACGPFFKPIIQNIVSKAYLFAGLLRMPEHFNVLA